jgi:predicted phosphodiesterase
MWCPIDIKKFDEFYLGGCSDFSLARFFNTSPDKIKKYLISRRENGDLPDRKSFEPSKNFNLMDNETENHLELKVLKKLKNSKNSLDIIDLANEFDVAPKVINEIVENLEANHYLVNSDGNSITFGTPPVGGKTEHFMKYINGNTFKFGVVSDTHLCSRYSNLEILNTLYDIFEEEGVDRVYLPGNYIDGEKDFNKNDIFVHGFEGQINYFIDKFPKRDGITTYFIDGDDHEGWYCQREGINVGQRVEDTAKRAGRDDLICLGYMEYDVKIPAKNGETTIRLQHPGGGSSYAISYQCQKIVESLSGNEKPNILILGHFHKMGQFFIRNVHVIQAGTTMGQSPFMRKKRLAAHLGGYVIEVNQGDDGTVLSLKSRTIPFYDNKQSNDNWEYKTFVDFNES